METNTDVQPSDEFDDYGYEIESGQIIRDYADNKVMEPVQKALHDRIAKELYRLEVLLRDSTAELKGSKGDHELVGIELYNFQQQLAKLQSDLEIIHNNCIDESEKREKCEGDLVIIKMEFAEQRNIFNIERDKLLKSQAELNGINVSIGQIDAYNKAKKGEIAVTRRTAYKVEELINNLEHNKSLQDFQVLSLQQKLGSLREQIALYESQLGSQKSETLNALNTLKEAGEEMNTVSFSIKQLMVQWKTCIIGTEKRDAALQAINETLRSQNEKIMLVENEIRGYQMTHLKEQKRSEQLSEQENSLNNEIGRLKNLINKLKSEYDNSLDKMDIIKKAIKQSVADSDRNNGELKNINEQIQLTMNNIIELERNRRDIEDKIEDNLNERATVSKAATNFTKKSRSLKELIHGMELEKAKIENEISRIKIDCINTKDHNDQLEIELKKALNDLKEKEALVDKYRMEIRQRNDEVDKEMFIVDRLNKKYEQLTQNMTDENMGPLEATIHNLQKEITQIDSDSKLSQQLWLKDQTIMVQSFNDIQEESSIVRELKGRAIILEQKLYRKEKDIQYIKKDTNDLEKKIELLHKETGNINLLLSENENLQEKLGNENFGIEQAFNSELRELEGESKRNEMKVIQLKEEKQRCIDDIVESERQIMLWEKKIQLEKESQDALDRTIGMQEAQAMEREIHRMELRYQSLKREQEAIIKEMERAIWKKETIQMTFMSSKTQDMTISGVKKNSEKIIIKLNKLTNELASFDANIRSKKDELIRLSELYKQLSEQDRENQSLISEFQQRINEKLYLKQKSLDLISNNERLLNKYEELRENKGIYIKYSEINQDEANMLHTKSLLELETIFGIINRLKTQYPHHEHILNQILTLYQQ